MSGTKITKGSPIFTYESLLQAGRGRPGDGGAPRAHIAATEGKRRHYGKKELRDLEELCACKSSQSKPKEATPPRGGKYSREVGGRRFDYGNRLRNLYRSLADGKNCQFNDCRTKKCKGRCCKVMCCCHCKQQQKMCPDRRFPRPGETPPYEMVSPADRCIYQHFPLKKASGPKSGIFYLYDGRGVPYAALRSKWKDKGVRINCGIRKLMKYQREDGTWSSTEKSFVFAFNVSIYTSLVLKDVQDKGKALQARAGKLQQTKQAIDAEQDPEKKKQALAKYNQDLAKLQQDFKAYAQAQETKDMRILNTKQHLLAFIPALATDTEKKRAGENFSGWILESELEDSYGPPKGVKGSGRRIWYMKSVPIKKYGGGQMTEYEIVPSRMTDCRHPEHARHRQVKPEKPWWKNIYVKFDKNPGPKKELKVPSPEHYVERKGTVGNPDGYISLVQNLVGQGGLANDMLPADGKLTFVAIKPRKGDRERPRLSLTVGFDCWRDLKQGPIDPQKEEVLTGSEKFYFLYGYVKIPRQPRRYGWIPRCVLKRRKKKK